MLISKGVTAVKALKGLHNVYFKPVVRNSGHVTWNYRKGAPPADKSVLVSAQIIGGFTWWWMMWHLYTEPDHITGEFEYPDARKWTDEELGITENMEIEY